MAYTKEDYDLYDEFIQKFSIEKLESLPLDKYTNLSKDSFCYWVENKLNNWGNIHGATSYKFGIYQWNENPENKKTRGTDSDDKYAWRTKYGKTAYEAYNNILPLIIQVAKFAEDGEIDKIDNIDISEMFKWKIAFLYSNKKLINWFSKDALIEFVNYFGGEVDNRTPTSTLQKLLLEKQGEKTLEEFNEELTSINAKRLDKTKRKFWIVKVTNDIYWNKSLKDNIWYSQQRYGFQTTSAVTSFLKQVKDVNKDDIFLLAFEDTIYAYGIVQKYNFNTNQISSLGTIINEKKYKYKSGLVKFSDSDVFYENLENGEEDWGERINVNKWMAYNPESKVTTAGVSSEIEAGNVQMSIYKISSKYGEIKMKELEEHQTLKEELANLLNNTKNIILHGAPGTGKTYLAWEIAQAMGCSEKEIGFVQFHPSYDYTDFVEGLRPVNNEDKGQIEFERKDGEFKKFCIKALESDISITSNNFNQAWERLINGIRASLAQNQLTRIGSWDYGLSKVNSLKYSSINSPSKYTFTITKKNIYDTYIGKNARPSKAFQKDMQDIVDYMVKNYELIAYKQAKSDTHKDKPYVFIIDEINRGELSKIFGELFYSIDPSYRGINRRIQTQYQNLIEEDDEFADGFYVPDNVYIIGTMNDIDRSVESMDFAMRRRFTFKEITAKDTQTSILAGFDDITKKESINRMDALNNAISEIAGLSSSYHIGGAYFKKLEKLSNDFDKLWEYHLEPLLREYLRGQDKIDDKINDLKKAYDLK